MKRSRVEIYESVKNSPALLRSLYFRKVAYAHALLFGILFMSLAYWAEGFFNVSGYLTAAIGSIPTIILAVFIAERKTNKKYGERK